MVSWTDFKLENVSKSMDNKWECFGKQFKRKGQAIKYCFQQWKLSFK